MVLMKKMSLLVLAFVALLPGCCCRDKKKESMAQPVRNNRYIETSMDTTDDIGEVEEEVEMGDMDEYSGFGDIDLDDEELKALLQEIEGEGEESGLGESEMEDVDLSGMEEESDETELTWIEEQADDELRKLYFTFNHYGIRADQKNALAYDIEQVKQLIAQAGSTQPTVVIEGHACQEGSRSYNIGLSERRAKVVADLFVDAGIDKDLIKVIGRGQECPVVMNGRVVNGSREDRAPNRRVEVRVIYT